MIQRFPDPRNALCPSCGEIIDRDEPVCQIPDLCEKERRQNLEIRSFGSDYSIEYQAFSAAERMVGHSDEPSFCRNISFLFRESLVLDTHLFQYSFGESGTI